MAGRRDGGIVIACEGCNASLEPGHSPAVTCPYCGRVQRIDPALIDRLEGYREAVEGQAAIAERERLHAEAWERTTARVAGSRRRLTYILGFVLVLGPTLAVSLGAMLMYNAGLLSTQDSVYIGPVATAISIAGIAAYFIWYTSSGRRKVAPPLPAASVKCPSCGAVVGMQAGQIVERCTHCGSALMPGEQAMARSIDAARAAARQASLERWRAERRGMAAVQSMGIRGSTLVYFIGGSFLLPVGGGAVMFTVGMIKGTEPFSAAIFVLWAMLVALVASMAGVILWQRGRRERLRSGLEAIAGRFRGRILGGLGGTVGWLDRHWAGPFDPHDLTRGTYNDSAEMTIDGLPVLVDLDPVAPSPQHRSRVLVAVACEIRGDGDAAVLDRVRSAGFAVQLQEGGVVARGDGKVARRVIREDRAVPDLAPVLLDLVKLARPAST